MGGNALKNTKTRRYSAEEYFKLEDDITHILVQLFPLAVFDTIKAYRLKESFGDMDIIISSEDLPQDYQQCIVRAFKPNEVVKNGSVLSFDYKELQIDLIVTPPHEYKSSVSYFAYNDLGNLIGRVAHMMGLKLGHDGLSYNWRIETYQFKNVILATDWKEILPILGYDYSTYERGFDTIEDIFNYVVSSPYFNKDIFLLHNRNHTSRVRDAKRKTYMEFLKWIETYNHTRQQNHSAELTVATKLAGNKDVWLPYLFTIIPNFRQIYDKIQKEFDLAVESNKRFNGSLIMQWTRLTGHELGNLMKHIRSTHGNNLHSWVISMSDEELKSFVLTEKEKYREIRS